MLSVNPASSGSGASSATDDSNIAAFVSQNIIGILSTVPGKPTAVVAVRGNASLAVTWTAPANIGGSAITNYLVKYSSNGGSTWTNFVHPVSTVPSLTVTGLTNGTAYVIKVIARNAVGISLPSANSTPATPATVPGIPTAVVAVRGNASLAVTWTAPASTSGSNITDYLVKYSSNGGSTWTTFRDPVSTATSCTVTGLTNGRSYVIKVIAKNAVGIGLPSANSAPATPLAPAVDIALSATSVAENADVGTAIGTLSTTDPDSGNTFTYTLVTGTGSTDNASFSIVGNMLKTAAVFNYEVPLGKQYSIRVLSTDAGGLTTEKQFMIRVTDVNETPTDIGLSSTSVAEKQPAGAVVGRLWTADQDTYAVIAIVIVNPPAVFTYSFVAGAGDQDNALFRVVRDGYRDVEELVTVGPLAIGAYSIRLRSRDPGGLFTEKSFTITAIAVLLPL